MNSLPSHQVSIPTPGARVSEAIAESRRAECAWPSVHYLWRLSPVVGWLNDRMLAAFGHSEAPILAGVPGVVPGEAVFVFSGLVPNQKSHPLVYEWIAVSFRDGALSELIPFETLIERTGLGRRVTANLRQLEIDFSQSDQAEQFKRRRDEWARRDIQAIHDEYLTWIEETMTTEPHPWIKVVCAMAALAP